MSDKASYFPGPSASYEVEKYGSILIVKSKLTGAVKSSGYDTIRFDDGTFVWDAAKGKLVSEYGQAAAPAPAPDPLASQQVAAGLASDPITHISLHYASGRVDMKAVVRE